MPSLSESSLDCSVRSVTVECPARIDIAGGWSDTPPITYEHGGAVINAAILVDGKRPIGARVEKIQQKQLQLVSGTDRRNVVIVDSLSHMTDYTSPQAPAALLKAAFVCAGIVDLSSEVRNCHQKLHNILCLLHVFTMFQSPLCDQLSKHGGGFELVTWSNLPQGSGLGTSSILAGAILAALWQITGRKYDVTALNHAVSSKNHLPLLNY